MRLLLVLMMAMAFACGGTENDQPDGGTANQVLQDGGALVLPRPRPRPILNPDAG